MNLSPKKIQCQCGATLTIDENSDWCTSCVRKVYYHEKDRRLNKFTNIWMTGSGFIIFGFLIYIFIELVVIPMIKLGAAM